MTRRLLRRKSLRRAVEAAPGRRLRKWGRTPGGFGAGYPTTMGAIPAFSRILGGGCEPGQTAPAHALPPTQLSSRIPTRCQQAPACSHDDPSTGFRHCADTDGERVPKGRIHISAEVQRWPLHMKSTSTLLIHPPDSSAYDSARENHWDSACTRSDAASAAKAPVDEYNSVMNSGVIARDTTPKSSVTIRRASMTYASFETSPFP
jgi:hypothetical protein